ncbi:hypothetical protein HPB48_022782 [Haemaphysalis longicornis]|uniref:Uncharacterized protein n=1 Tax=Haemaphysalis longicornis TaxID=44386 RepID=A0A9J6GXK5_HAELO|nr:hypothetical protein HPB48_022782 [Haemaphysalis longicornis]
MVAFSAVLGVLVPIRPHEVTLEACVGDVCWSHDIPDLLYALEAGRHSPVATDDPLIGDGSNGQAIGAVSEGHPQVHVVPALALVVEALDAVDERALVVASDQEDVLRVLDLQRQEEADGLQGLPASVHVVSEEEAVGLRRDATLLQEPQRVGALAVDVAEDPDRRLQLKQGRLAGEDVARLEAQLATYARLRELHRRPWVAYPDC